MSEDILERAKAVARKLDNGELHWQEYKAVVPELIAEVERLRSFRGRIARILGQSPSDCDDLLIVGLDSRIILAKRLTARIKELEARIGREQVATMQNREAQLQNVISSREAYIKLLEAAFLRSNAAMRYYQEGNRGPWSQLGEKFKEPYQEKAREALERIKEGGKDD